MHASLGALGGEAAVGVYVRVYGQLGVVEAYDSSRDRYFVDLDVPSPTSPQSVWLSSEGFMKARRSLSSRFPHLRDSHCGNHAQYVGENPPLERGGSRVHQESGDTHRTFNAYGEGVRVSESGQRKWPEAVSVARWFVSLCVLGLQ
uniref:Uncharacterized protein n=1 Tax=Chromera velia CCMP2878 TaxID=1169474 RepID=A0A0G4FY37_9ALVE|eukprot:Cvel_19346.t1-p1 / transcript=Cvel_19346.t1 / gene=Cvel_19346 / organism=Chromera_velia_CCMP2878 / gene_product=hypothetical protein / transcript_product=hypothetical protein / location=Cvel_scaffold1661:14394-15567(-) / protein_length=145 / sequence_SO=supercontig / SO=protein_coding / is_pseudo=false